MIGREAAGDVQRCAPRREQKVAQRRFLRAESNRFQAGAILPFERDADMVDADRARIPHAMGRQREDRLRMACAIGASLLQLIDEFQRCPGRTEGAENEEGLPDLRMIWRRAP